MQHCLQIDLFHGNSGLSSGLEFVPAASRDETEDKHKKINQPRIDGRNLSLTQVTVREEASKQGCQNEDHSFYLTS